VTAYRTIVADPPWRYTGPRRPENVGRAPGRGGVAESHYRTMDTEEIAHLPVGQLADQEAHLYLWVTNPVLTEQRHHGSPFDVVRAWGFEAKTLLTWCKQGGIGMGWYFRGMTEHVIFATRSDLGIPTALRESNVIHAPRTRHSQKPDAFMDLVERVSPGPRLEMFARRQRIGWDTWGDQAIEDVELIG
jgi:N6-adenosine-specific RNA methylase IME4